MNADFFAKSLEAKPTLLKRIIRFNREVLPASSGDEALQKGKNSSWLAALERSPSLFARYEAAKHTHDLELVSRGTGTAAFFWDFEEPSTRLALLSPEAISRLGRLAASALLGEDFAKVLAKSSLQNLKAQLGEDVYRFAILRGRFMAGSLAETLHGWGTEYELPERAAFAAEAIFRTIRLGWPDALSRRTEAHFTASTFVNDAAQLPLAEAHPLLLPWGEDGDARRRVWFFMKKIIVRELDSEWMQYFD